MRHAVGLDAGYSCGGFGFPRLEILTIVFGWGIPPLKSSILSSHSSKLSWVLTCGPGLVWSGFPSLGESRHLVLELLIGVASDPSYMLLIFLFWLVGV